MLRALGVAGIFAPFLAACASHGSKREAERAALSPGVKATDPRRGGVLHLAAESDIQTLDPAVATDAESAWIQELFLDTLVSYAADSTRLEPHLASGYTVSSDGRTYTFTLRNDAAFDDGSRMTAADVKASLERVLAPGTASPDAGFFLDIAGARAFHAGRAATVGGLVARDPSTVLITLVAPSSSLPYRLALKAAAPLPASERARVPLSGAPAATGPFRVTRFLPGRRIELSRNPFYWCLHAHVPACAGEPYLDGVTVDLAQSPATQLARLRAGELDQVTEIPHAEVPALLSGTDAPLHVEVLPVAATSEIVLDTVVRPLDDARVRRALNLAVSKERLRTISSGLLAPGACVLPPGIDGHDDAAVAPYPYDPARARALLASAGASGMKLEIAVAQPSIVADTVVADLRAVGVDASVRVLAPSAFFSELEHRGAVQAAYVSYAADYLSPDDLFDAQLGAPEAVDGGTNWSFFTTAALQALLDRGRAATDAKRRRSTYVAAEKLVRDAAPWIFLGYEKAIAVSSPCLHGAPIHPLWQREYRAAWLDR